MVAAAGSERRQHGSNWRFYGSTIRMLQQKELVQSAAPDETVAKRLVTRWHWSSLRDTS